MRTATLALAAGLCGPCGLASCSSLAGQAPLLATARVAVDFDSYALRRVGLLPVRGADIAPEQADVLQAAFFAEFSRNTLFEVVPLSAADLEEVPGSEPYRRGWYDPRTILGVSRRYTLDAVLVGTVTDYQFFTPQRLSVHFDLVAAESGAAIWSSSLHLDAANERVSDALAAYAGEHDGQGWDVALLSPRLFAQFAASQVAALL